MISRTLHFITLHHGHGGGPTDFNILAAYMQCAPADTIVLRPSMNSGSATDEGIKLCAERLTAYVIDRVTDVLEKRTYTSTEQQLPSVCSTVSCGSISDVASFKSSPATLLVKGSPTSAAMADVATGPLSYNSPTNNAKASGAGVTLRFSFVGHSMGGLIVRAALPDLADALQQHFPEAILQWDTFCTISTPHVGVAQMPSKIKTTLAGWLGKTFSKGLNEMLLHDEMLSATLLSDRYLCMWMGFRRRVLLLAANDNTVMGYSAGFYVSHYERGLLGYKEQPTLSNEESSMTATKATLTAAAEARKAAPKRLQDIHYATSLKELDENGWELSVLTPDLWPEDLLPRERVMAQRILECVGPLEMHAVDFRPLLDEYVGPKVSNAKLGAKTWAHRAIVCRAPCDVPEIFGFVSEFVAMRLFGMPESTPFALSAREALVAEASPRPA